MNKKDNRLEPWLDRVKQKLDPPAPASPLLPDEVWQRLEEELFAGPVVVRQPQRFYRWLSVAAVFFGLLVGGAFFLYRRSKSPTETLVAVRAVEQTENSVLPKIEFPGGAKDEKVSAPFNKSQIAPQKKLSDIKSNIKEETASGNVQKPEQTFGETEAEDSSHSEDNRPESETLIMKEGDGGLIPGAGKSPHSPLSVRDEREQDLLLLKKPRPKLSVGMYMGNSGSMTLTSGDDYAFSDKVVQSDISTSSIRNKDFEREYDESSFTHRLPLNIGIKIGYSLSDRFSLESGLVYTYLSSQVSPRATDKSLDQRVHYIGIPIGVNYSIWENRHLSIYAGVGGRVDKCISAVLDDRFLRMNPLQFSAGGRVGLNYKLSRHVGFYLEPGVSYFFEDGSALKTTYKENPLKATLSMGFRLLY